MKIGLISLHSFLKPGGVKTHVLGLNKEFKKKGIASKVIAPRRLQSENYGKNVILLGTSFPLPFGGSKSDFAINFNPLAIENTFEKENFDILHFHNFGFPSSFQILERSKALNILTFHSNIEGSEFLKNFPVFLYILKKIVQWKIDGIIGVAPLALKVFKNYSGPKTVIPNGIDLERFNPKVPKIKKFSDGKTNILFVGRIEKRKGLIYLLKAYKILEKKFSNLRLIIVGEGELKKDCQLWVRDHNLKEAYFEGERAGKELPPYFTSADIFCAPSIYGESFGIVLLEAMASGLPVVGFANQGYKELLKGKKGERFLVKPKGFRALTERIEILIKNKNLRKKMGEWGQKEAKRYSWPKITNKILNFYQFCQKKRQKRKREILSVEKILDEVNKVFNKDISDWLK
ncbi:glycosyltransferase family 4 protein [Patescibacteria group bacterium]|nr:glycosyltransferase family 4 protein [Patescibacteria group bacterium]